MSILAAVLWILAGALSYFVYRFRYFFVYFFWSLTKEGRRAKMLEEQAARRESRRVHFYKPEEIWGEEKRKSA